MIQNENFYLELECGPAQPYLLSAILQISVQIGLNWNWPTGTELGKNYSTSIENEIKIDWRLSLAKIDECLILKY